MAKYSENIRSIREVARYDILLLLGKKPKTSVEIFKFIKSNSGNLCDDSITCVCGKSYGERPEWKHQIRWALQDLKHYGKIDFNKQTKKYFLKKVNR